nr:3-ketoacyl-CoA synthase 10 [Ipomoea batatas]
MGSREEHHLLSTEIVNRGIEASGPDAGALTFSVRVRRRLPDFAQSVKLKYVKLGYYYVIKNWLCLAATVPLLTVVFGVEVGSEKVWGKIWENSGRPDFGVVISLLGLLGFTLFIYFMAKPMPIYLLDFACCKPSDDLKVTKEQFIDIARKSGTFEGKSLEYLKRMLESSGIGEETYIPKSIGSPEKIKKLNNIRAEASQLIFEAIDKVLAKTKIRARDIGILVVNCNTFNPTPSLSAMIINHYKMRRNIMLLDELKRNLRLSEQNMEASRATLHRFGNTSSSSIWYELAYLEAKGRVKPGNRIWQLALGSGFKCNSAVWVTLQEAGNLSRFNPWLDCLDRYPQQAL